MEDSKIKVENADVDESNRADFEQNNSVKPTHTTFGSGPSEPIADGGNGGEKQPKERTGKDSTMGGADGGIAGSGFSKETIDQRGENKPEPQE